MTRKAAFAASGRVAVGDLVVQRIRIVEIAYPRRNFPTVLKAAETEGLVGNEWTVREEVCSRG